ncbi:acyl-CoA dehydrogenase [Streptomyces capparidis]
MTAALRGGEGTAAGTREPGSAERLERFLGDPEASGPGADAARGWGADPVGARAWLDGWGLHRHYVPAALGGELTSYQELLGLLRTVARRDLTAAVAHGGTFLGTVCAWIGGGPWLARALAELVLEGEPVALGLTGQRPGGPGGGAPGGTPLAAAGAAAGLTARPTDHGYLLDGEQWLLGGGADTRLLCLLASTAPGGGPRGLTLLLADTRALRPGSFRRLPPVPTLGVRGAGPAGVVFDGAEVPFSARIGAPGQGVEILLKAAQLVRVLTPALSLGAADHALRLALRAARERGALSEGPHGEGLRHSAELRVLGEAYADLLAMEALSAVAARGVHLAPAELGPTSAAVRHLVPAMTEEVLAQLREVAAPRALPFGGGPSGAFARLERDHRAAEALDGSAAAGLPGVAAQLRGPYPAGPGDAAVLPVPGEMFDIAAPPPAARLDLLCLPVRRGSGLLAALPGSALALRRAADHEPALAGAAHHAEGIAAAAAALHREDGQWPCVWPAPAGPVPPEVRDRARRCGLLLTASACLGVWRHSEAVRGSWPDGLWLHAALARLRVRLRPWNRPFQVVPAPPGGAAGEEDVFERMGRQLAHRYRSGETFTLLPCPTGTAR